MSTRKPNRYNAARDKGDEAVRVARYHRSGLTPPPRRWSLTLDKAAMIAAALLFVAWVVGEVAHAV